METELNGTTNRNNGEGEVYGYITYLGNNFEFNMWGEMVLAENCVGLLYLRETEA